MNVINQHQYNVVNIITDVILVLNNINVNINISNFVIIIIILINLNYLNINISITVIIVIIIIITCSSSETCLRLYWPGVCSPAAAHLFTHRSRWRRWQEAAAASSASSKCRMMVQLDAQLLLASLLAAHRESLL